jgi:hypothetical protein
LSRSTRPVPLPATPSPVLHLVPLHAPARGGGQAAEKLMLARRARPDHPEERPRGQREALGQLDKLRSVEGRDAAERNVHDGAGRLRVEPRRARGILRPEAAGRIVA